MSFIAHQLFVRIGIDEWIEPKAIVYSCRGGRRLLVLAACVEMNATDAPMAQLGKPSSRNPQWMRALGRTLSGILVLAALALGWFIYRIHYANPRTDDAYVRSDSASVAAHVSGQILQLPIKDNQQVKKGDPPVRGRFAHCSWSIRVRTSSRWTRPRPSST
jgi:hypothetical protein